MAYRTLSEAEVLMMVRLYLSQNRQPRRGSTTTILTIIGHSGR